MTQANSANTPVVSVVSISYNHEAFIRDALEGFVTQEVDFPIEIIVADDASTDSTPNIIAEYAAKYPALIRPILRPENVGIHANLTHALAAARGTYIALCEGDDYWTDTLKLAKQVKFLDHHPEIGLCFHPARELWVDRSGEDADFPPPQWRTDLTVATLLRRNFVSTNSVMYRRLPQYDDIPPDIMPLDHYLHVKHALLGGVAAMLPETMGVYRRHAGGLWFDRDDPTKFWTKHARGHAALYEGFIELVRGDRKLERIALKNGDDLLRELAKVPGQTGADLLSRTVSSHPNLLQQNLHQRGFVALMLPIQRLRRSRLSYDV